MANSAAGMRLPDVFGPLLGQVPWSAWVAYGSIFYLDFGARRLVPSRRRAAPPFERGAYHLCVHHAGWRLEQQGQVVVAAETPRPQNETGLAVLLKHPLVSASVIPETLDLELAFGSDLLLRVFSRSRSSEHWNVRRADDTYFCAGPGFQWHLQGAHEPYPDEPASLPLRRDVRSPDPPYRPPVYGPVPPEASLHQLVGRELREIKLAPDHPPWFVFDGRTDLEWLVLDPVWSSWRLEWGPYLVVGSSDYPDEPFAANLLELIGYMVQGVYLHRSGLDARLEFDGGWALTLFADCTDPPWDWELTAQDASGRTTLWP
jgi:hypothetical protein